MGLEKEIVKKSKTFDQYMFWIMLSELCLILTCTVWLVKSYNKRKRKIQPWNSTKMTFSYIISQYFSLQASLFCCNKIVRFLSDPYVKGIKKCTFVTSEINYGVPSKRKLYTIMKQMGEIKTTLISNPTSGCLQNLPWEFPWHLSKNFPDIFFTYEFYSHFKNVLRLLAS